jgi:kynurenine formamidase
MSRFVDLSHDFYDGMPGFVMRDGEGRQVQYSASIKPFLTHAQSAPFYQGKAAFEITEITFQTSIGTYLDSPYHRYPDRRDIAALALDELILPGRVVDLRARAAGAQVSLAEVELPGDFAGCAVLLNFGWDVHWGQEIYHDPPFIGRDLIDRLVAGGAALVGVDSINIDDRRDPERPAHSRFLERDILVVENLRNLDLLHGADFRFYALPIKARRAAAMPVRAFAELGA